MVRTTKRNCPNPWQGVHRADGIGRRYGAHGAPNGLAGVLVDAALAVMSLCWALSAQTVLADEAQRYVTAGSPAAGLSACVQPTPFMRRNHMELIQHQRDATVHHGVRGTRHSLAACIECHVSTGRDGHPVAVNAEHQFCQACHAFAAVKVDCFDCHASVPKAGPPSVSAQPAVAAEQGRDRPGAGSGQASPRGNHR